MNHCPGMLLRFWWLRIKLLQYVISRNINNLIMNFSLQDHKVDVFSMGCVICFVLSEGQHPFGQEDRNYNIKYDNIMLGEC
jgi:serine/threonine protein kinase